MFFRRRLFSTEAENTAQPALTTFDETLNRIDDFFQRKHRIGHEDVNQLIEHIGKMKEITEGQCLAVIQCFGRCHMLCCKCKSQQANILSFEFRQRTLLRIPG